MNRKIFRKAVRTAIPLAIVLSNVSLLAAQTASGQQRGSGQPGTKWSDDQLRQAVAKARVGRKLTPRSWPNGARVAVGLTFDDDNESWLLRDGNTSLTTLSSGDYGAESGTPRILKMLDHYQVPATFFLTGVDAMLHPDMVSAIMKSGRNEIGVHGWIHEFPPGLESRAEEDRLLEKAMTYLEKITGKRPMGYRAPSWAFSQYTLDIIRAKGSSTTAAFRLWTSRMRSHQTASIPA